MFYSNTMTHGATLGRDLGLIERITHFVESSTRFLRAAQGETSDPPAPEAPPSADGSYCPLPPLWRFPWEQTGEPRPAPRLSFVSGALAVRPYLRHAKSLVLVVAMALMLGTAGAARAQQEVAPEHFDNPAQYAPPSNVALKGSRRPKSGRRAALAARARRTAQRTDRKGGLHSAS